jgi:hypothetical protein
VVVGESQKNNIMIKLKKLLIEGAILLDDNERQQVDKLVDKIIEALDELDEISPDDFIKIGPIGYKLSDGSDGVSYVYLGNDEPTLAAYYQSKDKKNLRDNYIVVQQGPFKSLMLPGKVYGKLTGDKNILKQSIKSALTHELIHAKDPAMNHHELKQKYDTNKPELYYSTWTEFQAMTGQFFEAIITGVDKALKSKKDKQSILDALNDILNFYSGKNNSMSQNTIDFIQDTGKRNIFQSLIKHTENFITKVIGLKVPNLLDIYGRYINYIKEYNPEGYKEFLKDLYKTVDEAKSKVKSYKEI